MTPFPELPMIGGIWSVGCGGNAPIGVERKSIDPASSETVARIVTARQRFFMPDLPRLIRAPS